MTPEEIHKILKSKKNGFYVDVGAFDGLKASNTKYFEDVGWQGIAIEPHPTSFLKLKSNRSCAKENILITDYDGECTFNWSERAPMTSRINMSGKKGRIHKMSDVVRTCLPCMTITSLCKKYSVNHIDFLKIDTEGSDWSVINGINFNILSISFIAFEMWNGHEVENYKQAIKKLTDTGFTQIQNNKFNYYFQHNQYN